MKSLLLWTTIFLSDVSEPNGKNAAGAKLYWDNRSLLFFTLYFKIDSLRAV